MDGKKLSNDIFTEYAWSIEVYSETHLDDWIEDCFAGLSVVHKEDGSSQIICELPDLPAVYGFILQLRDKGICLLSLQVERMTMPSSTREKQKTRRI